MQDFKITAEEFAKVSIARLATHPNATSAYRTGKMSERELKAQFDKQGELLRKKFNAFLDIIGCVGEGSLADRILTGIKKDHTLRILFEDIISESGRFAEYLSVGDGTLSEKIEEIKRAFEDVNREISSMDNMISEHMENTKNPHGVTATQIGLGNVDNTRDQDKPLSILAQEALDEQKRIFFEALAGKIGKVGDQSIAGRLSVNEIYVAGGAYTKDMEHLSVRDAVIIANSDGIPLSEYSGYVIRTDYDGAYGILYDPTDDCVKIGHGVLDKDKKVFVYDDSAAQALATRGDIQSRNLPIWDNDKHCFVDSGVSIDAFRKEVDEKIDEKNKLSTNALIGEKTGGVVTVDDVSPTNKNLAVVSHIDPNQGEGVPSFDNVLPLSPRTGVTLTRCGKNLVNLDEGIDEYGAFVKNDDGSYTLSKFTNSRGNVYRFSKDINYRVKKGTRITVTTDVISKTTTRNLIFNFVHTDGTTHYFEWASVTDGNFSWDAKKDIKALRFYVHYDEADGSAITFKNFQIELGDTATAYESYQGNNITLDFGQEIYGGTFDWSTGVLTIDRAKHIITADDYIYATDTNSSYNGSDNKMRYGIDANGRNPWLSNFIGVNSSSTVDKRLFCSVMPTVTADKTWYKTDGIASYFRSTNSIYFYSEQYETDPEGFKQAMIGAEIVFGITPVTVQLTPQQIEALGEITTLSSDTGDTTVKYNRDINKAFAELQQAIISLGGNV